MFEMLGLIGTALMMVGLAGVIVCNIAAGRPWEIDDRISLASLVVAGIGCLSLMGIVIYDMLNY